MTDWFIRLNYGTCNFLIPHQYASDAEKDCGTTIDFDGIVMDLFSARSESAHPVSISIKARQNAVILTSAIPTVQQEKLKDFFIPGGIMKKWGKKTGIMAISFSGEVLTVIVNPELLYEKWKSRK